MSLHKVKPLGRYPIGWHDATRAARDKPDGVWVVVDTGLERAAADTLILKLRVFTKALFAEDPGYKLQVAEGWKLRFRKSHNRWRDCWEVETALQRVPDTSTLFAKVLSDNC